MEKEKNMIIMKIRIYAFISFGKITKIILFNNKKLLISYYHCLSE